MGPNATIGYCEVMNLKTQRKFLASLMLLLWLPHCKQRQEEPANVLESSLYDSSRKFFSYFTPQSIRRYAREEWEDLKIGTGFNIFRLEPTDWSRITGRYRYEVRRQSDQGHLRMDRWKLGTDILPGTLIEDNVDALTEKLPVNITITADSEIVFIRRFATKRAAITALPRTLLDMPLNIKGIAKMQPGELVSLPVKLGLHLSLGAHQGLYHLEGRVGMGIFWTGSYRLNIAREEAVGCAWPLFLTWSGAGPDLPMPG